MAHIPTNPEEKRKISLEDNFMEWRANDLLYGELLYMATIAPDKTLYVPKDMFIYAKEDIMELCEYNSVKSLYNNLNRLIEKNLVKEGIVEYNKTAAKPSYIFVYEEGNRYQMIQREMVYYLISTRNKNCLRIYTYLLNKFLWKRKLGIDHYDFTLTELREVLHYESKRSPDKQIRHIIESFYREGLIEYECAYRQVRDQKTGEVVPSPIFRLTKVVERVEELPPVPSHTQKFAPTHHKQLTGSL